ncbi:hypothetical protein ERC79_11425 [Rhodococcus sp. ABRD24]|uniref:putative Ig domain-containing protein n=1 Tax=Rhodococcus sp. ABRD24 TaxID=2507582 RepID=UPI00103F6A09|nr:putative Ig domain-containing protein [Rhodococcus sp. ABRD24]QBJ96500.1 hypothetical protein ERC79_11425 [Rhodococcus sp. ABRD24]
MLTASIVFAGALALDAPPAAAADGDPTDKVVLAEDFSAGTLPGGWTSHRGAWKVEDGRLVGTSVGGERARVSFGSSYENYRLEATANFLQVANDSRWLNLAADYHGAEDYGSVFVVRSNTKASNGLEYAVSEAPGAAYSSPVTGPAGVSLGTGETHALSLEVRGGHAVLSIDGTEYLTTNDMFRADGTLGLVVNNATVAFDDIKVTQLAPEETSPGESTIKGFAKNLNGGSWDAGHVQGIAVDREKGRIYYSFTTLLVKTDLAGNVIGTVGGFTGHLGDLDFNESDGRVYGSLEYKDQKAFYIAVIDVDAVDRVGMEAQNSGIVRTVHLDEVVADYTADMDGNGVFDGNTGKTPDHRYGSSGIDGVSFGPQFGSTGGPQFLTVAYGIYSNLDRTDNDHQVLLQYDTSNWDAYAKPLVEADPHRSGPEGVAGKYFVRTGNTTYGVQNLAYDDLLGRWFMGVYAGAKPGFPNYTLFAVDAATAPVRGELVGTGGDQGMLIALAPDGRTHEATGIRGWIQKADVGMESLGDGLFYLARNRSAGGMQTADITLYRWTGDASAPFALVNSESELHREPVITSATAPGGQVGAAYTHTFTASAFPAATFSIAAGSVPEGLDLDDKTGILSGTPREAGRTTFTVAADNGVGRATQIVTVEVAPEDGPGSVGWGSGSFGSLSGSTGR